ncbi:aluminum-activated malate transporter 12 [Phtheirospermum japonicum]|uniref:Aluminum-activated malate transporter 12 n=1 Tax=Phtheirospermum japonicum TaxID=374723 RepID=A0A830CU28_9LAMI|nr:aluminum-activated malate transporter 12 [Phtheirospermum japonicum]
MMAAAPSEDDVSKPTGKVEGNKLFSIFRRFVSSLKENIMGVNSNNVSDARKVIHGIKVGIALVTVSLIYMVNPMFKQVGENAMWAVMTVVVMFDFYAGATLGKGINRVIGTLLGGVIGCLVAILGGEIGGIAKPIIIASSVFAFGAIATYCRQVPRLKKRYDYGFMIFILSLSLVAVSGERAQKVVEVGRDRIATVGMGFAVCIFVSLFICPIWASNELHVSTASKFEKLATRCLDEYFKMGSEKENQESDGSANYTQACKAVLNSKSSDETLPQPIQRQTLKDPCENFMLTIGWILKELGESIEKMELCKSKALINPKLQSLELQLCPRFSSCKTEDFESDEDVAAVATFNFLLLEIVAKVEMLALKVEELGEAANFRVKTIDV